MSQKRYTVWATKQTRYNGERVYPGQKIDNVTEDEMSGLMSSGRFTLNQEEAPEFNPPKPEKAPKADKTEKAPKADAPAE